MSEQTTVFPSHKEYLQTRFFSSLDGLRFLCIAAVLWHHSPMMHLDWPLATRGFLGVDMFFVLSGFLIVTLLLREHDKFGKISLKDFYVRRSLRIFPIYFLFIFGAFAVAPFLSDSSSLKEAVSANWLYLVTFTINYADESKGIFSHLWSLSVEEQFYFVWPFLEWKGRRWIRPLIGLILFTCILRDAGILTSMAPLVNASPFSRSLAWGVALAHCLHSEKGYNIVARCFGRRWACLFVGFVLVVVLAQPGSREPWKAIVTSGLLACFVASIVVQPNHLLAPFFRFSPIAYTGTISYGVYLYHVPVLVAVEKVCGKIGVGIWSLSFTFLYFAALFILSAISFEFFEKPILSQRKWFARTEMGRDLDESSESETAV